MQFRLIGEKGSVISVSTEDATLVKNFQSRARMLVREMIIAVVGEVSGTANDTPEIISDDTARYIEQLESALSECLSLMSKIDQVPNETAWQAVITTADELLH